MKQGLKIIVFAGLPLTGKTTLAKGLEEKLSIARLDVDEIRRFMFSYNIVDSEKNRELDGAQMWASWKSLFVMADNILAAGDSVIVAGTFSRESYHKHIFSIAEASKAALKIVFCHATDEVITQRIELRKQDQKNPSNLTSMEGYNRVRVRYVKISALDILNLDTSRSVEECLSEIMKWLQQ